MKKINKIAFRIGKERILLSGLNKNLNAYSIKGFTSVDPLDSILSTSSKSSSMINSITTSKTNLHYQNLDCKYFTNLNEHYSYLFSEYGYFKYRVIVEIAWLKKVLVSFPLPSLTSNSNSNSNSSSNFSSNDSLKPLINYLDNINSSFNEESFFRIKAIEKITNHDVKAVEYYIKELLKVNSKDNKFTEGSKQGEEISELTHFCCTSEDINNLSQGMILKEFLCSVYFPMVSLLIHNLKLKAKQYRDQAMVARTHGQPATPTTFGKEMANFAFRINELVFKMKGVGIKGKFNGAVGNYSAHISVSQSLGIEFDWIGLSKEFVESLGLEFTAYSTQIECHDSVAEILNYNTMINNVIIDLMRDLYGYNMLGYINNSNNQSLTSTNAYSTAEGDLLLSNSLSKHLSSKLPISRFQRDLSDSTVLRNLGVAFSFSVKAYSKAIDTIQNISLNKEIIDTEINKHWELLAEPMQSILRYHRFPDPYELMKEHTRGKKFSEETYRGLIESLKLPENLHNQLISMTPATYLGASKKLCDTIDDYLI